MSIPQSLRVAPTHQRVLIVDDIEDNRVLLERILARAGYETESCDSGARALRLIGLRRPDLVLLDWMMPGLSGIEVLKVIRETHTLKQLPIVMCTALGDRVSVVEAYGAGANDFIQKPVVPSSLVALVQQHLRRPLAA
ncbi:response regulator [Sphingomonas immobilis]|uniref:Response regulator n=1 Tax=Sphingomonas immobilis TaxID=3063997 RepID=A0ABT9A2N9_9SPHN|nr:response regulator [Sphingomonas sp. CA1-15]MDO7843677.1 response regulator [Sphingomonas sp. CA1-15]